MDTLSPRPHSVYLGRSKTDRSMFRAVCKCGWIKDGKYSEIQTAIRDHLDEEQKLVEAGLVDVG